MLFLKEGEHMLVCPRIVREKRIFQSIIGDHPNSVFVPRAMVQLGLLYFNDGDNQKAINQYKQVIEKYQSTPEARSALTGLRTTYVEMNDVESYFAYVRSLMDMQMLAAAKETACCISQERIFMCLVIATGHRLCLNRIWMSFPREVSDLMQVSTLQIVSTRRGEVMKRWNITWKWLQLRIIPSLSKLMMHWLRSYFSIEKFRKPMNILLILKELLKYRRISWKPG